MPKMSGYEVCRKIRERYSLIDLPILIITAGSTMFDAEVGFEAGANDFVTKPFETKELCAKVHTLLSLKNFMDKALANEMAFLQSKIKSHFLYNALSTIMSFCYTDGEKAGELLGRLSEYLKKSFNIEDTVSSVSLKNELELTDAYVEIEKARFGERLKIIYNIGETLLHTRVLPLTIQPFIRHGILPKELG